MLTICTTSPFLIKKSYTSLLLRRYEDTKIRRYEDTKIRRYEDTKIRRKGYLLYISYNFDAYGAVGFVVRVTGNIDLRAPLPNSYTNPTVRIPKNINTTQKPKVPTSYRLTVIGYNTNNSRSNTKNSIATK
jgi:hypothetical protein